MPPSATIPVLCRGPVLWSPPSRSDGDSPKHRTTFIGGQRSVRIAPPFLPSHHSDPAARDFQSSIPVETLLRGCHLDVQCLLQQTLLRRREDGSLDVSIYRKPTHTDRYLHFESHHPTHVKRGMVRCLHDRAREITSTQDNLQKEVDHLARVLKQNGYPATGMEDWKSLAAGSL